MSNDDKRMHVEFHLKPCIFKNCKMQHISRDSFFGHLYRHHRKSEIISKLLDCLDQIDKFPRLKEAIT